MREMADLDFPKATERWKPSPAQGGDLPGAPDVTDEGEVPDRLEDYAKLSEEVRGQVERTTRLLRQRATAGNAEATMRSVVDELCETVLPLLQDVVETGYAVGYFNRLLAEEAAEGADDDGPTESVLLRPDGQLFLDLISTFEVGLRQSLDNAEKMAQSQALTDAQKQEIEGMRELVRRCETARTRLHEITVEPDEPAAS